MIAKVYRTGKENEEKLKQLHTIQFVEETPDTEMSVLNIHSEMEYGTFDGFGTALTESAAVTWKEMSEEQQKEAVKAYFSEEGLGYTYGRIHIGSCDFSVDEYSYVEENDMVLDTFDISREEESVIPLIRAAKQYAPDLKLLASPWSPPKYMKDSGKIQGGHLKKECYDLWAQYNRKFILEMKKRGVDIWAVTTQNEQRAHQIWESCIYTPEQEIEYIKHHLGPALKDLNVDIYTYDHNKERLFERCLKYYNDSEAAKYIAGIACHWYSGDHFNEIEMCKKSFPDRKVMMSEGCVYHPEIGYGNNQWELAEKFAHDIIGDLNAGLDCYMDWNCFLNEENGPLHYREGRNMCDASIFYNRNTKELYYHPCYYVIGQFSKYIKPGAVRIGASCYDDSLEYTAFKNTDGSIALVVYNKTDHAIPYVLRMHGHTARRDALPHSVETYVILEDECWIHPSIMRFHDFACELGEGYENGKNSDKIKISERTSVFIGDSFFDRRDFWTHFYTESFVGKDVFLAGIGATSTDSWMRLTDIVFRCCGEKTPKNIVMHLGTNDFGNEHKEVAQVITGLKNVFQQLHDKYPTTMVYWFGITHRANGEYMEENNQVNTAIYDWAKTQDYLHCIDTPALITEDMLKDGLHPKYETYQVFVNELYKAGCQIENK